MAVLALDIHALVKDLKAAGFDDRQAEAVTKIVASTRDMFDLATKTNLRETGLRLEAKITTTVESAKAEIVKGMFGVIGLQTLVILGAALTLTRPMR